MKWYLNKLNWLGVSATLIISLFVGYGVYTLIQQTTIDFQENIRRLFAQAISMEKEKKVSSNNLFIATVHNNKKDSSNIVIENEREKTYMDKAPSLNDYTIAEKDERILQTYFRAKNPILPAILDSFFNVALSKQGIFARTAVCYKDNIDHKVLYSLADSSSLSSAYATEEVLTGLDNEISLQGFIFISGWDRLGKAKGYVIGCLIVWICICGIIISFLIVDKNKKKHLPEATIVTLAEAFSLEHATIRLTPEIYWDIKSSRLIRKGIEAPLTQQYIQLLTLFLNNPNHFVSHEEMVEALWGKKDFINKKDRLDKAIARFRKALKTVPEITIENDRGKGYTLTISTSEQTIPTA